VFSGVFRAEEDDEVGDKRSGDSTMVDVDTIGGLFEHALDICPVH
jgi:hypothetical protein